MENFDKNMLEFTTLMSPAFIAYVLYKKINNEEINTSMNPAIIIFLIALNIIVIGITNLGISFIEILSILIEYFFPSIFDSGIYLVVITILLIAGILFIILNSENNKINKSIVIAGFSFIFFSCLLFFLKDRETISFILNITKPMLELKYFDKKFFINPIAILIHSFCSLILLNLLDTKIIPFLRKLFYPKIKENDKVKKIKKLKK